MASRRSVFAPLFSTAASVLVLATSARAVVPPAPAIYNLGSLGGASSAAYAVNPTGQIAGSSLWSGGSGNHAFRYTGTPGIDGQMTDLGSVGGTQSGALGINANGDVAGYTYAPDDVHYHAMLYAGGIMSDLGTLGAGSRSWAYDINAARQVVGWSDTSDTTGQMAFVYTGTPRSDGTMTPLGTLGGATSLATAVNATGQIAGTAATAGNAIHAFLYTGTPGVDGHMADLGTLAGGPRSEGTAVNDHGQVAGFSYLFSGSNTAHAFLYTGTPGAGGHMADLGTIGGATSVAYGVNNLGQVAGYGFTATGAQHAILYTGRPGINGQMVDLDAWLDANNPVEGAKWTLTYAEDLNDADQIVGLGTYNDGTTTVTRAYLLDASAFLPEPTSLTFAAVAALSLVRRRRNP